jgi:ABC-2 type transport system permease protein
LALFYGAIGLFASSLVKNQVVALIGGMILCTFFFFVGQFVGLVPLSLTGAAEWLGVNSHVETLSRGVWDIRDLFYFASMTGFFLYLSALRLSSRRF